MLVLGSRATHGIDSVLLSYLSPNQAFSRNLFADIGNSMNLSHIYTQEDHSRWQ